MAEKISAIVVCVVVVAVVFAGVSFSVGRNQERIRAELEYTQQLEEEQRVQKEEQRKREEHWLSQQTNPSNGMTKRQVKHIWGPPIEKKSWSVGIEGWFYDGGFDAGGKFVWFKHGKVYIVVTTAEALRDKRISDRHIRIGDETLAAFGRGDMYAFTRLQALFIGFNRNEHIKEMSNGEFEDLLGRFISEEDPRITYEREMFKHELEVAKREREAVEFEREEVFRLLAQFEEERQEEERFRQQRRSADVTNIMNQFRSSGMMPSGY